MEPGTGTTVTSTASNSGGNASTSVVMRPPLTALFREIHKNSWLRRLNSDSRRPSVLNKKPDRYWVVFCVHDDCEAFLEGFSDPRQAPSHAPEWSLSLQTVQHISHALVSVEQEFEFVITLGSEVARFNANTWECMQEWVDCLRSKLREMKLLSPKENLYSRLPEVRPPLAPTRDPTSPLPATPPVPAAIVPGIERVQTSSQLPLQQSLVEFNHSQSHQTAVAGPSGSNSFPTVGLCTSTTTGQSVSLPASAIQTPGCSSSVSLPATNTGTTSSTSSSSSFSSASSSSSSSSSSGSYSSTLTSISSCPNGGLNPPAMSNTSTQNLMNLLSNPLQAVSSINAQSKSMQNPAHPSADASSASVSAEHHEFPDELLKRMGGGGGGNTPAPSSNLPKPQKIITRENGPTGGTANHNGAAGVQQQHHQSAASAAASSSLATTFVNNVLADPSGAVASLKRTDKLLLDVRGGGSDETNACDDEHVAEEGGVLARDNNHDNHDVVVSAGNDGSSEGGEEQQSLHQRHLQHAFAEISQKGVNDCRSVCMSNGSEPLHPSSHNDVVVSSESPTMASNCGGMQPSSIVSPAAVSGSRIDPKRSSRKISPLAVQSSPPAALHVEQVTNVTIIQVSNSSTSATTPSPTITTSSPKPMPRFNFLKAKPLPIATVATTVSDDDGRGDNNYKSNVQIIPSNVEYEQPNSLNEVDHLMQPSIIASINEQQITTVTVPNVRPSPATPATLGQAPPPTVQIAVATSSTPIKGPENNFGTVTQISVNSIPAHGGSVAAKRNPPPAPQHYEQVFFTSSSVQVTTGAARAGNPSSSVDIPSAVPVAGGNNKLAAAGKSSKVLLLSKQQRSSSHSEIVLTPVGGRATKNSGGLLGGGSSDKENHAHHVPSGPSSSKQGVLPSASSPAVPVHLAGGSPSKRPAVDRNIYTPHPQRAPLLQRGLTELVLSTRSSPTVVGSTSAEPPVMNGRSRRAAPIENKIRQDHLPPEQRRRSSSTSDARQDAVARVVGSSPAGGVSRLQSPPQPFRPHHPLINMTEGVNAVAGSAGGNRKLTLREQQVFQLRREMMHPGGVRLQLRRKDCINSIGLVDAFGGVWVAGWKQKEHPVLYNALHIGDQLISVAGVAISCAVDAHKTIRAAPGLFVELIIRRIPFGRVYAIRRELDGQCLGLIRDGNTATIVDVVPNSLAARHGLPPKAKSCDGLSLTFWVLTEINGRPLNLFFKEHEIRDRLNAVGRDISILVQPADLVTKLKKQLKSLRGHKDFIVQ
ncbi:mucin-5AC [Anopheles cruzii]|uniref:mucin-5AC n=1 Tax=Anopheles cruzii TaxID=68878 RepID=UPI0022EC73F3|nr:mucin-5AC [Anopheles cruzii]